MGRFYRTAKPEFIDFIFQPNLEMKKDLLDSEATNKYLKSKLLEGVDDVSFDYLDYDKDFANDRRDYYNTKADEVAQLAFESDNPKNYISKMKELQRELEQDYNSGDIFKMQENFKRRKEIEEEAKKLPNAADREAYVKNSWNLYINDEKQKEARDKGEFGDIYEAPEMFESVNYSDFLKSPDFKQLVPEEGGEIRVAENGKWLAKKGNSWVELSKERISSAFKNWLENNPNARGRFNNARYFGETLEDYYDNQGNLKFDNDSILQRKMDEIGEIYSYRNRKITEDKSPNPFSQELRMKDRYARNNLAKKVGNIGVKANNLIEISEQLKSEKAELLTMLKSELDKIVANDFKINGIIHGKYGPKFNVPVSEIEGFLTKNKENYPNLYNILNTYNKELNKNHTASRDLLSQALGSTSAANNFFKQVDEEATKTNWYFDFTYKTPLDKVSSENLFYPNDFIGKRLGDIEGIEVKDDDLDNEIEYVEVHSDQSSFVPLDKDNPKEGMVRMYFTLVDENGNSYDIIGYKDSSHFFNSNLD